MPKRKILFIIPSLIGGGAERTLVNLLHRINYNLYEIDLLVVLKKGVYLDQIPKDVNLLYLFKNPFFIRSLAYLQKKIGLVFPYKRRIKKVIIQKYDVGISFLDSNFTDLLFLTDKIDKKYTWVHSAYISNPNFSKSYNSQKYRNKLIKNRYQKLDGIYFVSENAKEEFIEVFGNYPKMEVIYNLINNKEVKNKSQDKSLFPKSKFRFVAIGSLYKVKGYDKLIKACKIVKDKGFEFEVFIAGKGPKKKYLINLVNEYKLEEYIKLVGFLENPYPLLKSSDVFIMTSISEALPTVLCEAMILSKPTLVTNCSGCKEIVNYGEFGLLAEQNPESIAENMIKYIQSAKIVEKYTIKSKERSKLFDENEILKKYNKVFKS